MENLNWVRALYWPLLVQSIREMQNKNAASKSRERTARESQVRFARHSVCDRPTFAPLIRRSGTAHWRSREKGGIRQPSITGSPFSEVLFVGQQSRKIAVIRVFPGKSRREFSAVQTAWRREQNSNSRSRFRHVSVDVCGACRAAFTRENLRASDSRSRRPISPGLTGHGRRIVSESVLINGHSEIVTRRKIGLHATARPARSPKSNLSPRQDCKHTRSD